MKPSLKKIYYDFSSNFSRSILVILSIAVGLFAIGVILTVWLSISVDLRVGYEQSNPANIYLTLSDFDNELVRDIRKNPAVKAASGSRTVHLRAQADDGELHQIKIQAFPENGMQTNTLEILEGSWPLEKGQIAIENYKFERFGLDIGDSLLIKTANDKLVPMTIAARVRDQSVGVQEFSQVFIGSIAGYITQSSLSMIDEPNQLNLLKIAVNGDGNDMEHLTQVSTALTDQIKKANYLVFSITQAKTSEHPTGDYINAIAGTLLIIGVLILFLSGTLIYNTLSAILAQQIRQIGAMKTIGATYRKLVMMYMYLIFVYSLIALAISIPTSIVAANWFRQFLAHGINYRIVRTGVVWETIVVQVVLGLLIPQLAGFIPVRKGAKISIQRALSKMQSASGKRQDNSGAVKGLTRIFPRPVALSLRNTFSNRTRLFLTMVTLSIGGGIFIASFNVTKTIDNHVKSMSMYFQADLSISMMDAYRPDRVEEEMKAIPGVISVEGWGSGTAVVKLANDQDGPTISINAPPENTTLVEPKMKMGRWLLPGESNVIVLGERFLYSFPELQVGDKIKLDVNKTGKNSEWTIVGFFSMGGKSGGFLAYIPLSSWMTVSGTATRLSRYEVCMDESVDLTNIAGLTDTIESQLSSKGFNVRLIQKNDTFIRDSSSGLNILSAFLFIIAILVAFVGSIGMTGTMSLNVMERTREIGILRSIGASDKAVMENVLTEGVMIGILSWLGGIILSFPIQKFMSDAMGFAVFGSTMETAFAWIGYVLWLFLSIIIAVLASIMPAKNAIRLTIREVLSIE